MDNIISKVFSMKTMTAGLVIFLLGIGAATFIESKIRNSGSQNFDIQCHLVYDSSCLSES